ncbi:MAG: O-antigen ligase family protein [Marinobacter sp.]|uniref:O-antigen ligase family protein n=1 Tax=Marinobacter sp. TaxID=50741 RepID=UPI00299CDDF2|nr:O-antigen ligase family protein [Marinobacter sp.]MDX1634986.1 O-antigen ligase family protein [Marinobacter sp.]
MKSIRDLSPGMLINVSLLAFLFLALLVPWKDLYRVFFFLGVMPGVLWSLKRYGLPAQFRSAAPCLLALLIIYLACNSFFVSAVGFSESLDQFRWGIEVLFLMGGVLIAGNVWIAQPRRYGLLFLSAVAFAGLSVLIPYLWEGKFSTRLAGYGFLSHPIQGASTLLVLWTMGVSLLGLANAGRWLDRILVLASAAIVIAVAVFSQSRGPVIAGILMLLLAVAARGISVPRLRLWSLLAVAGGLALVAGIGWWASETPDSWLYQVMTQRGFSYRPEIWSAILANCQGFWLWGEGTSTDFANTAPGSVLKETMGYAFDHSHNLFLQTFLAGGMFALTLLLLAIGIMVFRLFRLYGVSRSPVALTGLGVMLVTVMVNFTDTARLLSSPTPDWVLLWLPLFFVSLLTGRHGVSADAPATAEGRGL